MFTLPYDGVWSFHMRGKAKSSRREESRGGGSWQHKVGYNGLSVHLALEVSHHGVCQVTFCLVRKR